MAIKKSVFILIINFFCFSIQAQEMIFATQLNKVLVSCDHFLGFDNQNNLYTLKNNILTKNSDSTIYQYNNLSLGKITNVDFQNPLQIVVFYKNFNTVILLDNQLNEIKKIDFNLHTTPLIIEAVALSSQNQIWIYDSISAKIGLYNVNTNTTKWISTMLENPILHYESDYTHLYWMDTNLDLFRISLFGAIEKIANHPKFDSVQLTKNGHSIYFVENQLFSYNLKTKKSSKIAIEEKIISKFFFKDGILSIFTQNEITNYKIILP